MEKTYLIESVRENRQRCSHNMFMTLRLACSALLLVTNVAADAMMKRTLAKVHDLRMIAKQ